MLCVLNTACGLNQHLFSEEDDGMDSFDHAGSDVLEDLSAQAFEEYAVAQDGNLANAWELDNDGWDYVAAARRSWCLDLLLYVLTQLTIFLPRNTWFLMTFMWYQLHNILGLLEMWICWLTPRLLRGLLASAFTQLCATVSLLQFKWITWLWDTTASLRTKLVYQWVLKQVIYSCGLPWHWGSVAAQTLNIPISLMVGTRLSSATTFDAGYQQVSVGIAMASSTSTTTQILLDAWNYNANGDALAFGGEGVAGNETNVLAGVLILLQSLMPLSR